MRIDKYLVLNNGIQSRNRALILLEKKLVTVNGKIIKPSYDVKEGDIINISQEIKYVSMGGYKLEKALVDFKVDLTDKVCADIGCSTGGFTQCALNFGAKKVYAIDVNTSILDKSISADERVETIEINARQLNKDIFSEKVDFFFVDCSFISLKLILPPIISCMDDSTDIIALIKPQFECGAGGLTKKGLVKDSKIARAVCLDIYDYCRANDLGIKGITVAPIRDNKNLEFPLRIVKGYGCGVDQKQFENLLKGLNI